MRVLADLARARILARHPGRGRGIKGPSKAAVHLERSRYRWRKHWQGQPRTHGFRFARSATNFSIREHAAGRVDWNRADRVPRSRCRLKEVKGLARH